MLIKVRMMQNKNKFRAVRTQWFICMGEPTSPIWVTLLSPKKVSVSSPKKVLHRLYSGNIFAEILNQSF